jgi:hypothetical protein
MWGAMQISSYETLGSCPETVAWPLALLCALWISGSRNCCLTPSVGDARTPRTNGQRDLQERNEIQRVPYLQAEGPIPPNGGVRQ